MSPTAIEDLTHRLLLCRVLLSDCAGKLPPGYIDTASEAINTTNPIP